MSHRSRILVLLAVAVAIVGALTLPARAADDDEQPNQQPQDQQQDSSASATRDEILAVVKARGGELVERGDDYRLVLTGVAPRQLWFTDRPARLAGEDSLTTLHDELFSEPTPPNAALEVTTNDGEREVVILEISNPRYDSKRRRLTYDAAGLDATSSTVAVTSFTGSTGQVEPKRFKSATLFIDSAPLGTSCPASLYPDGDGYIVSLSGIDCPTAQAIVGYTNGGAYEFGCLNYQPFPLPQGTWGCQDQQTQAPFEEIGTGTASFFWMAACRYDNSC